MVKRARVSVCAQVAMIVVLGGLLMESQSPNDLDPSKNNSVPQRKMDVEKG